MLLFCIVDESRNWFPINSPVFHISSDFGFRICEHFDTCGARSPPSLWVSGLVRTVSQVERLVNCEHPRSDRQPYPFWHEGWLVSGSPFVIVHRKAVVVYDWFPFAILLFNRDNRAPAINVGWRHIPDFINIDNLLVKRGTIRAHHLIISSNPYQVVHAVEASIINLIHSIDVESDPLTNLRDPIKQAPQPRLGIW